MKIAHWLSEKTRTEIELDRIWSNPARTQGSDFHCTQDKGKMDRDKEAEGWKVKINTITDSENYPPGFSGAI